MGETCWYTTVGQGQDQDQLDGMDILAPSRIVSAVRGPCRGGGDGHRG
eukprot:CAMPEP_0196652896 /NCGR_PEP_ID=MMETSP1086-20130531/2372_1 /TAXON_ID=77921 /ORGANISM="Cyanoptyche  gloeocystis , Strain SAG4.97" /LENGTH=47 /DNA_ID= /DNA_START= /DNA_END= /DNA_ORIENTATION=